MRLPVGATCPCGQATGPAACRDATVYRCAWAREIALAGPQSSRFVLEQDSVAAPAGDDVGVVARAPHRRVLAAPGSFADASTKAVVAVLPPLSSGPIRECLRPHKPNRATGSERTRSDPVELGDFPQSKEAVGYPYFHL